VLPVPLDAPWPRVRAALFRVPSIVAMRHPTEDVFIAARTGICIAEPTPERSPTPSCGCARIRRVAHEMGKARHLAWPLRPSRDRRQDAAL